MKAKKIREHKVSIESYSITYSSWYWLLPPFLLILLTFLFYWPSLNYAFQFDDLANIVKFYDIRNNTFSSLFFKNQRWMFYWLSTIYYNLGRFDPFYYRLGNVISHTATGILLFYFCMLSLGRLKKQNFFSDNSFAISLTTAALFLLHPVQTQTVSYVTQGQLEGLAGLFIMAALVCFLLREKFSGLLKSLITMLLFVITFFACGVKEIVIVLPVLLLLVDWFFVAQGDWRLFKKQWLLQSAIAGLVVSLYIYFLKPDFFLKIFGFTLEARNNIGNILTEDPDQIITPYWFCISQFKVLLHYMWIFVWPVSICVDYDWHVVRGFLAPDCILPFLLLCGGFIYLVKRLRRNKLDLASFAFLWFFIVMLPRSSIIPSTELMVDYKTYVASIGILFLIASAAVWCIAKFINLLRQKNWQNSYYAQPVFFVLLFALCGWGTYDRNKVWQYSEDFWLNIIHNAPTKARAYNNYGVALSEKTEFAKAIPYFEKAIKMDSKYPDPCNNKAVCHSALGQIDLAIESIQRSISIQPYYPEGYNNLASFYMQKSDFEQAEFNLRKALKLRPYYGKAYFNLGRLYLDLNKPQEAWENFKNACMKGDFDTEVGFNAYGVVSLMLNKHDDAITAFKRLLEVAPNSYDGSVQLGTAYCMKGEFADAQQIFNKLLKINSGDAKVLYNLGETYWAQHNYQEALQWFEKVPQNPHAQIRCAECYTRMGNKAKARLILQQLLTTDIQEQLKVQIRNYLQRL